MVARLKVWATLFACMILVPACFAQVPVTTSHIDNHRTNANVNETVLSPSNVSKNNFGRLFSQPFDYQALAQPLYVPNVNIPGSGLHNVVYVATMADSVYAFDAESNAGSNAVPLWQVNFTNPANGVILASGTNLPCTNPNSNGPGFNQEGIVSTPVVDVNSSTLYVIAKTVEAGTVRHRLHALDLATGQEKFGGSVVISASSTSNLGKVTNFNSLHQKNRPGLLLSNGFIYAAFGSNYCNDGNTGWILAYDATTLQQVGAFNTNPDHGLTSVWQSGQGLAADDLGNLYGETGEGNFDANTGGQGLGNSVFKLSTNPLAFADYFTPSTVLFLNAHDLDLSSTGPVVLPDQDGPHPHEVVAAGKQGTIYLMDRDNMGQFNDTTDQMVQELPFALGFLFSSPAYWNNLLYFSGHAAPLKVYSISGGLMSTLPIGTTTQTLTGSHSPSISANGNSDAIVWVINGGQLWAFDAVTLKLLYNTHQVGSRDSLPELAHFVTQTVANGRVYVATRNSLEVYGLFHSLNITAGANQTGPVSTALPIPIQIQAARAYTGQPMAGVTVNFTDNGKGGVFSPTSGVTDSNGFVSTSYTFPMKAGVYTLTASATDFGNLNFIETAISSAPTRLISFGGGRQTGAAGTVLPTPITVQVQDANKNGVPGVSVTFDNGGKGNFLSSATVTSDAAGKAGVTYQLPNLPGKYTVKASAAGLKTLSFTEFAVVGPAASVSIVSGNNQSAPVSGALPQPLVVVVTDQAGNAVSGASVVYSAPTGTIAGSPATTGLNGIASATYTAGTNAGPVTITATSGSGSVQFTETVTAGPAASVSVTGGNNQAAPAGTPLPQLLSVRVVDQYGNPVQSIAVLFADGGVGGQFSNSNPVSTDNTGTAAQGYTLPPVAGAVLVTATASGVPSPASFTETAQ